jgi:hypothetical protein
MKLTFEEWKKIYSNPVVDNEVIIEMQKLHNVNAIDEIEWALRKEYEAYISGKFDK